MCLVFTSFYKMEDVDHLRKGDGINVLNSLIRII